MNDILPSAARIGWIGTGRMGYAMAARLLGAGYDVAVWNRTRAKAEPLAEVGATIADTIAELAERDVVFTMVSTSADLAEVTMGDGGVLRQEGVAPRILVDSSTVDIEVSADVRAAAAKLGTAFVAAPVSGNGRVADAGRLSIVASGPEDAFRAVQPYLSAIGRGVTYAGEGEVARLVKICHNIFLGVVTQALAEVTVLAEKGGVSRAAFLSFLNGSVMGSTFTRYKTPAFVNLDLTPTFTPVLLRKDFDLGMDAAHTLAVPMPVASLTHQLIRTAIGHGHVDEDFAVLLTEQAKAAGLTLVPEHVAVTDGLEEE
ncbi:MAG TPA: NAD(P)-dependent oxidoreductase [Actinophytocola sp.]|uniref:NAD(P)-dependent oxidoreductase n=1 Tax=Actinophytocola sp. TaxID=1872138 RepID=UPI002DDD316B|nr:NAD(P)-dependent oxidoreductase [Actinophytocola sp.]HEV2784618.1 NAD(P)-dependent oxidoreductase [Actinophytocola sp.]